MNQDPIQALLAKLESGGFDPRPAGPDQWESRCPAHKGGRRNLSIRKGDDGRALVHCHHADEGNGCDHKAIVAALGLTEANLFPSEPERPKDRGRPARTTGGQAHRTPEDAIASTARKLGGPTASWIYQEADGCESFRVYRFDGRDGKEFRPAHPAPEGWILGDPAGPLVLYHLPELADAETVFVTEGEKCSDLARKLGMPATTSAHGAKSARKTDWGPLAGKTVVILPDNDPEGESYAKTVAGLLSKLKPQPTVKIVKLPVTDEGDDLAEWLQDVVPELWEPEQCRAELQRLADVSPAEDLGSVIEDHGADNDEAADEWGPIRIGSLPPAEPFPLDVLPAPARRLAEAAAESIACPVDYPAVAILAAASGIIGRSASLLVKPGYFASASLYAALVGSPSSGKSPALRAALAPLWSIAAALYGSWQSETDDWKQAKPEHRREPPELVRIATTDPTTEALAPILAANPRGMTIAPDEMTKWVMSMDQYKGGKGGDRPFYLSAWAGEPVYIDRAKQMREPIAVPQPFLTVIGGMTPDMLSTLAEGRGREDGFTARLLFCFPERLRRRYSEKGIPEAIADDWNRLALTLWGRKLRDRDGKPTPQVVRLTLDAAGAWSAWCQAHYAEQDDDGFPESMEGPWGKLEAYTARLALILHLLNVAADPTRPDEDALPDLPRRIINDAARLASYFKSHARRVYATMGGKSRESGDDVKALIRWVVRNHRETFSKRDIERNFDRFKDDPAALADALDWMTRNNLARPHAEPKTTTPLGPKRPGRKRSPAFEVNPALHTSPRFRQFRQNPAP